MPTDAVDIPICVRVRLTEGWGGERWDVCDAIDERTGQGLGDIGIYDFDAYSDFPDTILTAVLKTLAGVDEFKPGVFYSVQVVVKDGGTTIGQAFRHFHGPLASS